MFEEVELRGGRKLFIREERKFKTLTFRILLEGRLDEDVEEEAILPFLLKRGCRGFPSQRALARALAELYGTGLALDIAKAAHRQLLVVSLDLIHPRFIPDGGRLVEEGMDLLNRVLLHPLGTPGSFRRDLFQEERRNLERYVKSVIDDKILYAHLRLVEEMYKGDPFGNYEWGRLERIARIEPCETYRAYRKLLRRAPLSIYVVGGVTRGDRRRIEETLALPEERDPAPPPPPPEPARDLPAVDAVPVVVEEQPLSQSKLEMGFHVDLHGSDDEYHALLLYTSVLGGGSFSKLFKTVRERHGLAYYVHASMDRLKGFLSVAAGIDADRFDAVLSLIRESMDDLAEGRIPEDAFEHARRTVSARLRSVGDNPGQMIEYDYLTRAAGRSGNAGDAAERIAAMPPEAVQAAARRLRPGCIFFLKGTGGDGSG